MKLSNICLLALLVFTVNSYAMTSSIVVDGETIPPERFDSQFTIFIGDIYTGPAPIASYSYTNNFIRYNLNDSMEYNLYCKAEGLADDFYDPAYLMRIGVYVNGMSGQFFGEVNSEVVYKGLKPFYNPTIPGSTPQINAHFQLDSFGKDVHTADRAVPINCNFYR